MKKNSLLKRVITIFLAVAMVLGAFPLPESTLTVHAEGTHSYIYSAAGDTLTATCNSADCSISDHKYTVKINAPARSSYGVFEIINFCL